MENQGDEILRKLAQKGFFHIHKEDNRSKSTHECFIMEPHVRLDVMKLALSVNFFCTNTTTDLSTGCVRVMLNSEQGLSLKQLHSYKIWGSINTLFNIDESILRIDYHQFKLMKKLTVLCLGNWHCSASHHIEADDTEFLECLKYMKHLRVLSLRGVSRIVKLPSSVSKLSSLEILDLRACHDLEVLPKGMGALKKLTHLNLWGCYQLLDHMPQGIASLPSLKVLKGFVVGERKRKSWCSLEALPKLKNLEKLSIHTTDNNFPSDKHLAALQTIQKLKKLTIEWGGKPAGKKQSNGSISNSNHPNIQRSLSAQSVSSHNEDTELAKQRRLAMSRRTKSLSTTNVAKPWLPRELEKLDLRCVPHQTLSDWLAPNELQKLKKLYIRGGELQNLGNPSNMTGQEYWKIERLRLKFLTKLHMDWPAWENCFPNLQYMEIEKCPRLSSFPVEDGKGWQKLPTH